MIDEPVGNGRNAETYPFMDELLSRTVPEVKLALGELIDRENTRALPARYVRLLPDTLLVVALRPDAAEALAPIKGEVERELTDSCRRHGSLYDRSYRVELRRTDVPDAPLFQVSSHAGTPAEEVGEPKQAIGEAAHPPAPRSLPLADPDATRIDGFGPPGEAPWQPGRWLLVVTAEGEEREVFRLTEPVTTVGRRTDDPMLQTTVALSDVPHVSRRQLVLAWEPREEAPGFRVMNVGLPPVRLPGLEIPGANLGRAPLRPDSLPAEHSGWLPPGVPLEIGESGPTLRIEEVPAESEDPDATVFE
jgi:hypothetical protein